MFMRRSALFVLLVLLIAPVCRLIPPVYGQEEPAPLNVYYGEIPDGERTFFVAPDGDDAAAGTEEEPWATLDHAVEQVQRGDVIVMRGGVYHHDDIIRISGPSGSQDDAIVVTAYPGEVPILDFSSQPKERNYHGIRLNAWGWHLIGLTIRSASHNGIRMDGWYNILEQLTAYGNHDTGIHMAGGASHNLVKNSDSFHNFNYDPVRNQGAPIGGNADGFSAKFEIGPGNRFVGCRAWENSDDGWDFWRAEGTIVIDSSWAFGNGDAAAFDYPEGFDGNGNGFKLGGDFVAANHVVTRSIAFDNFGTSGNAKGFDFNNNPGAMTLAHNTAFNNGRNYIFSYTLPEMGQAVFLNNVSALPTDRHAQTPPDAVLAGNSWQDPAEVTEDMFLSVDTELAKAPRQEDGSLPEIDLLKPVPGSFLVDGGVAIGEPYYGDAPDIGAYELRIGEPVDPWIDRGSGDLVADLKVYDVEHAGGWSLRRDVEVGEDVFGDGQYTLASAPDQIRIDEWLVPAAESRTKNYLFTAAEFTVTEPRHVLVAHADAIEPKPEWLAEYQSTGLHLSVADADGAEQPMTIYQRQVDAGETVRLGRNSEDGVATVPMYLAFVGDGVIVSAEPGDVPGTRFALGEPYPNPVSGRTTISFSLPRPADVAIRIYDAMGREVAAIAGGFHNAGFHTVTWDASPAANGVYYCHMTADGFSAVRKLVRIR